MLSDLCPLLAIAAVSPGWRPAPHMQHVSSKRLSDSTADLLPTHRLGQGLGSAVVPSNPERTGSLFCSRAWEQDRSWSLLEYACPSPRALRWPTSLALRSTWVS